MKSNKRDNNGFAVGDQVSVLLGWDIVTGVIVSPNIQGQYLVELSDGRQLYFMPQNMKLGEVAIARMLF